MNKSMMIAALSLTFGLALGAQNNNRKDVPEKVLTAFKTKFPNVQKVKWDVEDKTVWEAEFKLSGTEYSASFDTQGNWKETEHEVKKSELPANVRSTLERNFTDYEIEEAEISERPTGKFYELEIEVGKEDLELTIDSHGNIVDKSESREGEKEDED